MQDFAAQEIERVDQHAYGRRMQIWAEQQSKQWLNLLPRRQNKGVSRAEEVECLDPTSYRARTWFGRNSTTDGRIEHLKRGRG